MVGHCSRGCSLRCNGEGYAGRGSLHRFPRKARVNIGFVRNYEFDKNNKDHTEHETEWCHIRQKMMSPNWMSWNIKKASSSIPNFPLQQYTETDF
jgi:hypothetical protein